MLVGRLDANDLLHSRAEALIAHIRNEGHGLVLLDVLVVEAVSVLCRRAQQRKTNPPDLRQALVKVRGWLLAGDLTFTQDGLDMLFGPILDVIEMSTGALNFNDALLVMLQREGVGGEVATFDELLARFQGFRAIS